MPYVFQPYDILQVEIVAAGIGTWTDFATLHSDDDERIARGAVNSGQWDGRHANYRIARNVIGKGRVTVYTRERSKS